MGLFGKKKKVRRAEELGQSLLHERAEMIRVAATKNTDNRLRAAQLRELAKDKEIAVEEFYVAIGQGVASPLQQRNTTSIHVCVGACRDRGSLDLVEELSTLQGKRENKGKESFDIVPSLCLNRCQRAPACEIRSDAGAMPVAPADAKSLRKTLNELLG